MDWFGADGSVNVCVPCTVDFELPKIRVSYDVEGKSYTYSGADQTGHGHFVLRPDHCDGRATLFGILPTEVAGSVGLLPGRLEGSYVEAGVSGMWRLKIATDPLDQTRGG